MKRLLADDACPRCLGGIPNNAARGMYPGALSRTDNETEICSACGTLEALEDFSGVGCAPQSEWKVNDLSADELLWEAEVLG